MPHWDRPRLSRLRPICCFLIAVHYNSLEAMLTGCDTAKRNMLALAGLRIAVGCLFLIFAQYKVLGRQFTLAGGFQWWINRFLQEGVAYPFMVPVLQRVALPHATAIAFLVAYGELAIGLALVSGIWVRTASVFGFIYILSLLFQLPQCSRSSLAVFRCLPGPFCACPLLSRIL